MPVWLRIRSCVFLKTQEANVWLKKKIIYYTWSHSQIACGMQEDEKHKNIAFGKFNHDTLFTEQYIMSPPLFTE